MPRGYVVVIQDARGRFESEGDYYALIHEARDGYDTVEWAAGLPWSDGRVGTIGQSYLGATQYLTATARPPHLRCAVPVSASADFHQSWVYHTGGAFVLGWQVPYAIFLARDTIDRQRPAGRAVAPHPTRPRAQRELRQPAHPRGLQAPAALVVGRGAGRRGALPGRLPRPPRRRALLVVDQHRAAAPQREHPDVPRQLLVRHLLPRRARQLQRAALVGPGSRGPGRPEAADGAVGSPVPLQPSHHPGSGRHRLRARCARRPARRRAALPRPLAQGRRQRGRPTSPRSGCSRWGSTAGATRASGRCARTRWTPWYLHSGGGGGHARRRRHAVAAAARATSRPTASPTTPTTRCPPAGATCWCSPSG